VALYKNGLRPEAFVQNLEGPKRSRTIALDRFKETTNGYRLVNDPLADRR